MQVHTLRSHEMASNGSVPEAPVIYHPKCILITGGAGFIASHVVIRLAHRYPHVKIVVFDKVGAREACESGTARRVRTTRERGGAGQRPRSAACRSAIGWCVRVPALQMDYCSSLNNLKSVIDAANVRFIKGDIQSLDLLTYVFKTENVDTVMHFAAQVRNFQLSPSSGLPRGVPGPEARAQGPAQPSGAPRAVRRRAHCPTGARGGEVPDLGGGEPPRSEAAEGSVWRVWRVCRRTWTTPLATRWPSP